MPDTLPTYALAISAPARTGVTPVVYDLAGDSVEIGSAENNHIVLTGPGVEPYHLALRRIGAQLCALVDLNTARRHGESFWLKRRSADTLYCPDHGVLDDSPKLESCPLCRERSRALWLLRPLDSGDIFPIGKIFKATVLSQASPNQAAQAGLTPDASPWPDAAWLAHPPRQIGPLPGPRNRIPDRLPEAAADSNLWVWSPPESPIPVFMHQRANYAITCHALNNSNREVGGLLLGDVYQDGPARIAYPVISHAIPARHAAEMRGHLTFTHDTWLDLMRQREEHHPDREVVGWYHTHPGFGIFLSQWDLEIHRYFFREPWQVALVVDPHEATAGFFVWANGDVQDPQQPHQQFRIADVEDGSGLERKPRIRIKLGEFVP